MQVGRARTSDLRVPLLQLARWVGWVAAVRLTHGVLVLSCPSAALRVCGVLGHLAHVHRCARVVVLCLRCPGPIDACSPVCPPGVLCCVCGVLCHLAPAHRCARWACCVAFVVSWATWLLFTGARARCVVVRVRCPGPLGSCSPVCPLGVLCCVCGVLGNLAPVHRCARVVCPVVCVVSWATWLLFTAAPARWVVLRVRCPAPLGSCSPVCPLGGLCCLCAVLGHLALVHRCARSVCCVACAVSCATWLPFTGAPAWFVLLCVWCPGRLGSCSPLRPLGGLCCVCGVLRHLAPVHRCARSVGCVACALSWATWLSFTGVPARCAVLRVRCPGPLGSRSPVCLLGVVLCVRCPGPVGSCSPACPHRHCSPRGLLCSVCCVLGHLAPVHRCARVFCCVACAVSWATWLLFTGVPARCVLLRVRCHGPLGSCSPVCLHRPFLCFCRVLGHLAPVHRCARSVCCVACAVSWATPLLFTGVPAPSLALLVPCPGPLGSCSPVCTLGVLFCVCGVLGHLTPLHRCACSVCCVACAVSWVTWFIFTGVPAPSFALLVRCPGALGSCSPVCPLGVWCCLCGVLGHSAPIHRCACSVLCFACAVSLATWLLLTGVHAWCVVLCVRCPGPPGSCSPVCPLDVLCCVCSVPCHLAPVHRCARPVPSFGCAVSWATWLQVTVAPARLVVLRVRCRGPLGYCSPVCPLAGFCCAVLGRFKIVHRCARSVCCALTCAFGVSCAAVVAGCSLVGPDGGCS